MTPLTLIATLGPMLPQLIKSIETLFPPKTGQTKNELVNGTVKQVSQALAAGGLLPALPEEQTIRAAVQLTVDELKAKGELQGTSTKLTGTNGQPTVADVRRVLTSAISVIDVLMVPTPNLN